MSKSKTNRNNRDRGKAYEKKMADYLGFFRVPYSGSAEVFGLGDIRDHESQSHSLCMGECKSITPRSQQHINYTIQEKWLVGKESIIAKAKKQGNKLPFLAFTKVRSPLSFITIRDSDFKMFMDMVHILRHHDMINDTTDVDKLRDQINAHMEEINNEREQN